MKERTEHTYRIDNMRAVAILLVVFAHSVIIYDPAWTWFSSVHEAAFLRDVKTVIAMIHMPIFTFLSGYLFHKKPQRSSFPKLLRDKAKRILIPYFVFALFWMIPIKLLVGFSQYTEVSFGELVLKGIVLGQYNGHLWYCYFIFAAFVVAYLLYHGVKRVANRLGKPCSDEGVYAILLAVAVLLYAMKNSSLLNVPGVSRMLKRFCGNFVWFCFGSLTGAYLEQRSIPRALAVGVKYGSLAGFCLTVFFYFRGVKLLSAGIGLLGILGSYCIVPAKPVKALSALAKNSFGMFLFHSPFVYVTFTYLPDISPVWMVLINFGLFGTAAYAATILLRRTRLKFILGE